MGNKYTIVTKQNEASMKMEQMIREQLNQRGYVEDDEHPDSIFIAGGDGTFIYAVHKYLDVLEHVCFYGIHTGTLGFYSDYRDTDFDEFMRIFFEKEYETVYYPLLEATDDTQTYYAINEIRVENAVRTQEMDIKINGVQFERYRGTGICIATQWGSTGYSRSLGGAAIQEGLRVIEMCEVAGIHHSMYRSLGSPLIMKDDAVIDFYSDNFKDSLLGGDSSVFHIDQVKHIRVRLAKEKTVKMLRGRNVSYFDRLQSLF